MPVAKAVGVPAHLAPPGSLQAKQLHHLHAQPSLGQSCHRQKKVFSCVQLFAALWTVARQASLSSGVLQARYWNVLANTSCHTLPTSVQFSPSVVSDSL